MLFLINTRVHLTFHVKSEEKLLLFFLHYFTVLFFYSLVWKFSEDDMMIFEVQKWRFRNHILLLKSRNVKFNVTRLNMLLNTVWDCYIHFSDDYLLISMTIYNFRCLYNILDDILDYITFFSCIHLLAAVDSLRCLFTNL